MTPAPLPEAFAETRDALHRLAVYVISPAQRLVNGEIIMRATPGGFSTFPFEGRVVGVDGIELVVDGARHPIGSLSAAARAVGIEPDTGQQEQFDAAIDMGDRSAGRRATYGASPGDGHHAEPYLYASPWEGRINPFFDDAGFRGAACTYSQLLVSPDPEAAGIAFLRDARALVQRHA
jgi:hypothetical protein